MSNRPLISVCHPTARISPPYPSFPRGWYDSYLAFMTRCKSVAGIEYVISVHESNWKAFWEYAEEVTNDGIELSARVVCNEGPNTVVSQANYCVSQARGQIIMGGMDDLFPPQDWDELIVRAILNARPPTVLHVRTGSPTDETNFIPQIFTRALYEEQGYVLHPSYESMFADNEFTEVAKLRGIVIDGRHIVFEHRHPAFRTAKMDKVYEGENRQEAYREGLKNFVARQAFGFPAVKESLAPEPEPAAKDKLCIALCLPGETVHSEYVGGVLDVYGDLLLNLNMTVVLQQAFSSNVYCTRMIIARAVLAAENRPDLWLWLDDDNRISSLLVRMLLADLAQHPEYDAVVGWCWCDSGRENDQWQMSCGHQDEQMRLVPFTQKDFDQGPVVPIEWSGFPCVLIRDAAMRKLGPEAFQPIVRADVDWGFTSEDTSFWWNFRKAGLKVAVDLRCELPHMKTRIIKPMFVPQSVLNDALKTYHESNAEKDQPLMLERTGNVA